jgi:hypothetical protein
MNRREFLASTAALAAASLSPSLGHSPEPTQAFPTAILQREPYVETQPIADYRWAPAHDLAPRRGVLAFLIDVV